LILIYLNDDRGDFSLAQGFSICIARSRLEQPASTARVGKHAHKIQFTFFMYTLHKEIHHAPATSSSMPLAGASRKKNGAKRSVEARESEKRRRKAERRTATQPLTHNLIILLSNYFTALHHSQPTSIK
jgi:hypothetical protein